MSIRLVHPALTQFLMQFMGGSKYPWAVFTNTRPLGAVVGDFLDKPTENGGLELSRYTPSAVLLGLIVLLILVFPSRPAKEAH